MPGDTHTCTDCGGRERNPNPIDTCNRDALACNNPCGAGPRNTAKCESLPSQIENFTTQFFGTVVKSVVNGKVVWTLPCSLDVGLPGNPRGVDEGLACYFLRLFQYGLVGLKGDAGATGASGADGKNAWTVTTQGFAQPTPQNPLVQVVVVPNPSIFPGINVFIANSGYYLVTDVQPGGVVFATFQVAAPTQFSYVPSGSIVVPTGANAVGLPGAPGGQGLPGIQGPVGGQGPPGPVVTHDNGLVVASSGTPFALPLSGYQPVVIGGVPVSFVAPESGIYLIQATLNFTSTAQTPLSGGSPETVTVQVKLHNATTTQDYVGSINTSLHTFTNGQTVAHGGQVVVVFNAVVGMGETVEIRGQTTDSGSLTTAGLSWFNVNTGVLSWVRIV